MKPSLLALVLCSISTWGHTEALWLENAQRIEPLAAHASAPVALIPWFSTLSTELQQQWQPQLERQLMTACHRIKAAEVGPMQGLQVSRHGVQWFDEITGQSHRLLTSSMQSSIGRLDDAALPWVAWDDGGARQLIWQDGDAGPWRSLTWVQGRLQRLDWQHHLFNANDSFVALSPRRGHWFGNSVVLVPASTHYGIQLLNTESGLGLIADSGRDDVAAWPAALDIDGDEQWDRFYQTDLQGRVWRLTVKGQLLEQQQIADLSDSGWQFDGALNVVQAQWPTADGQWVQGDVLIIVARANPYGVVVLPLPDGQPSDWRWQDLRNVDASPSGNGQGWYLTLGSAPVANSQVMAGVLYLPLHYAENNCTGANTADQLMAIHLFQGTAVYAQRFLTLPRPAVPNWLIQRQGDHVSLQLDAETVIPQLHQISASCDGCSRVIEIPRFNRWQPLGVFASEQGAY